MSYHYRIELEVGEEAGCGVRAKVTKVEQSDVALPGIVVVHDTVSAALSYIGQKVDQEVRFNRRHGL